MAWEAGAAGQPFPDIHDDLENNQSFGHKHFFFERAQSRFGDGDAGFRRAGDDLLPALNHELTRHHRALFLGPFQKIDPGVHNEWDHILAFALAKRAFRNKWHYGSWTNLVGNFAGIDARLNRRLQKVAPRERLEAYEAEGILNETLLTKEECQFLLKVQPAIAKGKLDEAGESFRAFVKQRTERIWNAVIKIVAPPPRCRQEPEVHRE
jgi:hypothetical protein